MEFSDAVVKMSYSFQQTINLTALISTSIKELHGRGYKGSWWRGNDLSQEEKDYSY